MGLSAPKTKVACFGLFKAEFEQRLLTKGGLRVRLQDQPFQVLALLLERPGEIVTRDEIRQKLWSVDTYVEFDDGLNTAIKKLRLAVGDVADNPRFIETVPRHGYRFIAPVTFQVFDPGGSTGPGAAPSEDSLITVRERSSLTIEKSSHRRTHFLAYLLFVALLGWVSYVYWHAKTRHAAANEAVGSPATKIRPRRTVAVLGFRNASARPDFVWVSTAISEMLSTELSAGEKLRIVPEENVVRSRLELGLSDSDSLGKETLSKLGKDLGTDLVVLGSYVTQGKAGQVRIRLDFRLQNVHPGETIAEESVSGTEGELFELVSLAGSRLRGQLGIPDLSSEDAVGLRASLPADARVARLYSEGLGRLRVFDGMGARDALLKTVARDPQFALAHSALAETWTMLGYDDKAREEGKRAFDLSDGLSRPDRLFIEGTYHQTTKEWGRAIEIFTTLFDSYSDNPDYGLRLASALTAGAKPKEAIVLLAKLDKLPLSAEDPRIDISRSEALLAAGDLKQAQATAATAAEKARRSGARLLFAQALDRESDAFLDLGDLTRAIDLASEERKIYASVKNKFGVAAALSVVGSAQWYQGKMDDAVRTFEAAQRADREVGNRRGSAEALSYIGAGRAQKGDLLGARIAFEEAIATSREINAKGGAAGALSELAWTYLSEGNLRKARDLYEETVETYRSMGSRTGECNALEQLGLLLVIQGDLAKAETTLGQALEIAHQTGDKIATRTIFRNQGILAFMRGNMTEARNHFTDALQLFTDASSGSTETAFLKMWLAKIDLAEGHAAEAEGSVRAARQQFQTSHDVAAVAQSSAVLIEALLAQSKRAEAEREVDSGLTLVRHCPFFDESIQLKITLAQVTAVGGKIPVARRDLSEALAQAKRHGFPEDEFQAALSLGELEMRSNNVSAGREQLRALEKSATARGFLFFAHKASLAASRR